MTRKQCFTNLGIIKLKQKHCFFCWILVQLINRAFQQMYQGIRNVGVPTEYNRTKNLSKIRNYVLKFFSSDLSNFRIKKWLILAKKNFSVQTVLKKCIFQILVSKNTPCFAHFFLLSFWKWSSTLEKPKYPRECLK